MSISELEPKNVFKFFEEISKIPHGSGNTSKLIEYCCDFAQKRNLKFVTDLSGNVIIYKPATKGYENCQTVILQGHLDMVAEKTPDCKINMDKEPIILCHDNEYIWADKTTLGGDDGIAIAYMLAILDSNNISHPPIEALFTNDEEIGLLGVRDLNTDLLKGKRLINIDSEEEGILTVSCAGGVRAYCELPLEYVFTKDNESALKIKISGLQGGHSGVDINKHRKNAHILMGRLLQHIARTQDFTISNLFGGNKTNVIPQTATATICTESSNIAQIMNSVKNFENILKEELFSNEPNIKIDYSICSTPLEHTTEDSTRKIIFTLQQIPNGILAMSPDVPNMVQTSLNMGELSIENKTLKMGYLIRSNASTGKQLAVQKLHSFIDYLYGSVEFKSDYPAWEYRAQSPLRDIMIKAYDEVYADHPQIDSIHAGLECGILSGKMPDVDMVSFGPTIKNVHTPNEKMEIASVLRCWKYLVATLKMCD